MPLIVNLNRYTCKPMLTHLQTWSLGSFVRDVFYAPALAQWEGPDADIPGPFPKPASLVE